MRVVDRHRRRLDCAPAAAGRLIDTLSSPEDRLWPGDRWPPMRFDRPLGIGADGGHAFIRYHVESYEPGVGIVFRITGPRGLSGVHRFDVVALDRRSVLTHTIDGRAAWWFLPVWLCVIRPLHGALIEDALDNAERECTGAVEAPRRWSPWVRALRRILGRGRRPAGSS